MVSMSLPQHTTTLSTAGVMIRSIQDDLGWAVLAPALSSQLKDLGCDHPLCVSALSDFICPLQPRFEGRSRNTTAPFDSHSPTSRPTGKFPFKQTFPVLACGTSCFGSARQGRPVSEDMFPQRPHAAFRRL
jgi:hypothetical protein